MINFSILVWQSSSITGCNIELNHLVTCKNWTFFLFEDSWGSALTWLPVMLRNFFSSLLPHTISNREQLGKVWRQWRGNGNEGFPTTSQTAFTKYCHLLTEQNSSNYILYLLLLLYCSSMSRPLKTALYQGRDRAYWCLQMGMLVKLIPSSLVWTVMKVAVLWPYYIFSAVIGEGTDWSCPP